MQDSLQQLRRMMANGNSFEHAVAFIESRVQLDGEERAVLWLVAWSGGEPSTVVRELARPLPDDDYIAIVERMRANLTSFGS